MRKLNYINPPRYNSYAPYRPYLQAVSDCSCSYCSITESESPGATFVIEHFRPKSLFPELECECSNLRYACPRCNSYKSNLWITEEQGCNKSCLICESKVCNENIERFIDCLNEDPAELIYLDDDNNVHAYPASFAAKYTIEFLRLNRAQLIKLRYVRRFMVEWIDELEKKLGAAKLHHQDIENKKREFDAAMAIAIAKQNTNNAKEQLQSQMVGTLYEMMMVQSEQSVLFIESEIDKLNHLLENRRGSDARVVLI